MTKSNDNEMVSISLFDQNQSNHSVSSQSTHGDEFNHLVDMPPLLEYEDVCGNSLVRWFRRFSIQKPRLFTFMMTFIFCSLPFIIALIVTYSQIIGPSSINQTSSTISTNKWDQFKVKSYKGAVASDNQICSQIGVNILSKNGNAVDAAVATRLCLGVISPASSGLGGGCYILIHNSTTNKQFFIDSREFAPGNATYDMFINNPISAQDGALAIAVPAELKGLHLAWTNYGSGNIEWKDLVIPAAVLASEWTLSDQMASYVQLASDFLTSGKFPLLSALYLRNDGTLKLAGIFIYLFLSYFDCIIIIGDKINQPELSYTLQQIAIYGPNYLYQQLSSILANEIQLFGGIITKNDFELYEPIIYDKPIRNKFYGYEYVGVSGSSSGGPAVAGILEFMSGYLEPDVSVGDLYYHRLAEAFKHTFAIRLSLG